MPRPARPWFRFYSDAVTSLKVHDLSDRQFRFWVLFMGLANINRPRGNLPSVRAIAFALHVKESQVEAMIATLIDARLIDTDGMCFVMHDWEEWQAAESNPLRVLWKLVRRRITPLVYDRDGRVCAHCGATEKLSIDHIRPLAAGGSNDLSNLQVLCKYCNSRKGMRFA